MSGTTISYGLNPDGFVRMRLPEIRRAILNDLAARTGHTFDETPDSFTGQFISIFAEREAALWELAELAYLSAYPATAQGIPMDLAVSYAGVTRIQPVKSRAPAYLFGLLGTVIPAGSVVQSTAGGSELPAKFTVETTTTLNKAAAVSVSLSVPAVVVAGTVYSIDIDGQRYAYTSTAGQTAAQVATALDAITPISATASGAIIIVFRPTPFAVNWSPSLTLNYITCAATLVSEIIGPIAALAKTLTRILTPIPGWSQVYNSSDATPGTTLETDEALRARYQVGVYRLGAGTVPSILANLLQNVPGVLSAKVYENITDVTDLDGRPPHSIEAVVEGADTQLIFNQLHALKPAGITAHGNTSGTVIGTDDYSYPLKFSRPEIRWIWLRATLTTTLEETVPGDVSMRSVAAMVALGSTLGPGQDVLLQRIAAAPFEATTGVARVVLTAAVTPPNAVAPTLYSAADIVIGPRQRASFDASRVTAI